MTPWYVSALLIRFHELKERTAELRRRDLIRKAEQTVADAKKVLAKRPTKK